MSKEEIDDQAKILVLDHLDAQIEFRSVTESVDEYYIGDDPDDNDYVEIYNAANGMLADVYQVFADRIEEK